MAERRAKTAVAKEVGGLEEGEEADTIDLRRRDSFGQQDGQIKILL